MPIRLVTETSGAGNLYTEVELQERVKQASRREAIIFCAEMMYRKDNPNSKMDVPSIVYEHVEKQYDKRKGENNDLRRI